jgi:methylaspartate mutase sigma subunit
MNRQARIVIGVIGNDIHIVANRVLARGLRQAGYTVCNLGVSVTPSDFVAASIEFEADAVIISSINGEGEGWVQLLRQSFNVAERKNTLLYIGGNLAVGDRPRAAVERNYLDLGFDRVYHRPSSMGVLLDDLANDLLYV